MAGYRDYTQLRRILMQVVLCAALGATLGLAYWVEKTHAAALAVTLEPPKAFKNQVLDIDIRLPAGWKIELGIDADSGDPVLRATELYPHYRVRRQFELQLSSVPGRGALPSPEEVAEEDTKGRQSVGPTQKLDFLGTPGVLIEYPFTPGAEVVEGRQTGLKPMLLACAVLPRQRVKVTLLMVGPANFAAADVELIRSVATGLALDDAAHPAPELTSAPREAPAQSMQPAVKPDNPDGD